jgi:hypothetical protein
MLPSAPAAAPVVGVATAPLIVVLAASRNLDTARAAPTLSLPTVPVAPTGRLARAPARANVAALPGTVETIRGSAVLAVSLFSEPTKPLRRMLRLTAPVAPMERHVLASAKAAAVAPPGTAGLAATFVALAANQASEPATMELRTSRQTACVVRTAKRARDLQKVNVAVLLGTAEQDATSAAPAASQGSGLATPTLEASRPTGSAARTARPVQDSPRASVVRPLDIAAKTPPSAARAASPPLAHATAALEASPPTENAAAKTARRARASPRASAAARAATVAVRPTTAPPAVRALLALAILAPAPSQLTERVVARTERLARASLRESAAARAATAELRLVIVVLAARMLSVCAAAVRAPSQLTETAPRTGRLARARPLETAAALPTTAAIRPLIVALGGKSNTVYPIRDGTHC